MKCAVLILLCISFSRSHDPIVIQGKQLAALLGVTTSSIRLLSQVNGHVVPIPFQIDERTRKGGRLFDMMKEDGVWRPGKKDTSGGILTPQDEVVFMASDLGGKVPRKRWPSGTGMEIAVSDPVDGGMGYAYALAFIEPPTLSPGDYVRFRPGEMAILTGSFAMGFTDPARSGKMNYFAIGNALEKKEGLVNILNAFRMRIRISLFFGKITVIRDESQVGSELEAYTDGPVRVLRKIAFTVPILGRIPSPRLHRVSITYRDSQEYDNALSIPFRPSLLITKASLQASLEFTSSVQGSSLIMEGRDAPHVLNASSREEEYELPSWIALYGAFGGFLARVGFESTIPSGLRRTFAIVKRGDGNLGMEWGFEGLERLKRGTYSFRASLYSKPGFQKGDEKTLLVVEDSPLTITIR